MLAAAWPLVVAEARPDATLTLLGKGALEQEARALSVAEPSVAVEVDPSRPRIHSVLDEARVLVLPSQPRPDWREQVGLPIVEGLAAGCPVVTTTETGIAGWLDEHGHGRVRAGSDAGARRGILATIAAPGPRRTYSRTFPPVTAVLPPTPAVPPRDAGGDR